MPQTADPPSLGTAARVRLADQVVAILVDAMLDGRLPAGSSLPPERELAAELDVNRTSLRQAIARLEQMGVVEARQGRGTVVRDLAHATDPALMAHLVARDRRRMLAELFEVREGLAALIGRLAAQRASARDRRALRRSLDEVAAAPTAEACQRAELDLFGALVAATGNRPLVAMQRWVDRAYGDAAALFSHAFDDPQVVAAGLAPIVDAVDAGEAEAAAAATAAYAAASAERMLAAGARTPRTPTRRGARR